MDISMIVVFESKKKVFEVRCPYRIFVLYPVKCLKGGGGDLV